MRQPSLACALCVSALHFCRPGTWPACDHLALQGQEKTLFTLHSSVFTALHFARHTSSHLKPHFSNSWHTANFYTEKLLHTEARSFCTQKLLHREAFTHSKLWHRAVFTDRSFYTEKLLHTAIFETETNFSHTEAFTQSSFWTQKLLHKEAFTQGIFSTQKLAQGTS